MKLIKISRNKFTKVDDDDFEKASRYKWCALKSANTFYAIHTFRKGKQFGKSNGIRLHSLIMNPPVGFEIDHINGDGLDNQKSNLRIVTRAENGRCFKTKQAGTTSMFRGVYWNSRIKKWRAHVKFNQKQYHCGYFLDETLAAIARDKKAIELGYSIQGLNFRFIGAKQ